MWLLRRKKIFSTLFILSVIFIFNLLVLITTNLIQYLPRSEERGKGYRNSVSSTTTTTYIHDIDDQINLIEGDFGSGFEGDEYECTGSCFCEEEEDILFSHTPTERRSATKFGIGQSFRYLVVAFSSLFAYTQAEKYFSDKCAEVFQDDDSSSRCQVQFEVEECQKTIYDDGSHEIDDDEDKSHEYYCYGHCVKNLMVRKKEALKTVQKESIDCQKLRLEGKVEVSESDLPEYERHIVEFAKVRFEIDLVRFCKHNSRCLYDYQYPRTRNGNLYFENIVKTVYACVGHLSFERGGRRKNIHCIQREQNTYQARGRSKVWWKKKRIWSDEKDHSKERKDEVWGWDVRDGEFLP